MFKQLLSAAFMVATTFVSSAMADCDAILNDKLMSSSLIKDEDQARYAFSQSFCNKSFQEMGNSGSFAVGVKYKIFGANFNKSESSFNSWKTENCGSQSSDVSTQKFRFAATKALSPDAVAAWEQCNKDRSGLTCWMKPSTNENEVVLALNYRSTGNVTAKVLRSHISNGKNPDLNNSAILYDANSNFAEGEDNFILERIDIAKDLSISLTLEESTNAKTSCTASAPAYVVVPPAPTESEFKQKQEAILAKLRDVQVNTSNQACGGLMNMITDLKGSVASQQEPSEPDASANAMEKAAYQRALDGLTSADQDADVAIQQIHQNGC